MARKRAPDRYPRLRTSLPPHLHARLQAAAMVLRTPLDRLVETALEAHLAHLDEGERELIDRLAAETVTRMERE
ncbi:MAG TPA: hypothetical protein VMS86_10220 [Thermoanaerobaculia bacterium]|nr:hypothetical protein [Thermoanaerobaculia bacterium]